MWAASRDDAIGDAYAGDLSDAQAVALVADLSSELVTPEAGTLFAERPANTMDLLGGSGDPQRRT